MRNRRIIWTVLALVAIALLVASVWSVQQLNRRERETAETLLDLRTQGLARHVNAWNPVYDPAFQVYSGANQSGMLVELYDLAGNEPGRLPGSRPIIPLNEFAVRMVWPTLLRPMHGETPFSRFPKAPPQLAHEKRFGNLFFATNTIGASWVEERTLVDGTRWLVATTPVADWDEQAKASFISAWLQAAVPVVPIERAAADRWLWLAAFWATSGAGLVFFLRAASAQRRSQRATATAAEKIEVDRLASSRLPEPVDDPDGLRLARACNRLLDRVAEIHAGQQRFVADAAHELRTPLTILRGEIQVALRESGNNALLVETLKSNLDESVHLSRLVDSLLTLARADAGQVLGTRTVVDLEEPVRRAVERLRAFAQERGVRLEVVPSDEGPLNVAADVAALERVVFNLVDNAVRHSRGNKPVEIRLTATRADAGFQVVDQGIGIGPEHLPRLFDRFYRVDTARRRADGGSGLGLAIVKTIVEAHGGTISVESEVGIGSRFTVMLPRVAAEP